jgi:hypothetical protein
LALSRFTEKGMEICQSIGWFVLVTAKCSRLRSFVPVVGKTKVPLVKAAKYVCNCTY